MAVILVVDDDAPVRVLLNALLADELGHQVVFAQDGEIATERFERADPDLVIADLVMPKMDGIQLIKHLTTVYPAANIIAISGKGPEALAKAAKAGAVATLSKPLKREELVAAVAEALQRRHDVWRRGI